MAKHKLAFISLTVRDRAILSKFLTHRVSQECILFNFQKIFPSPKMAAIFEFLPKIAKHKIASISLTVRDRAISSQFSTHRYLRKVLFTGPCKITVQFLQKVDRVDITHDNVCSSMLSCFYSYVAGTSNRASYF